MKNNNLLQYLLCSIVLVIFIFYGCDKYEEPASINSPKQYSAIPKINSIVPADSASAGVREITILGENFPAANSTDTNWIYIGGSPVLVKSVAPDKIVVYRPRSAGRGLTVDVVIPNSLKVAQFKNYGVESPVAPFGSYTLVTTYPLYSMEVDKNENVFVGGHAEIFQQTPDGLYINTWAKLSPTDFNKITDIKFGPGGFLYAAVDKKNIYRFDPAATDTKKGQELYVTIPKNTSVFDFSESGAIYCAKKDGIYYVDPTTKAVSATGRLSGPEILQIRVIGTNVYSLTADKLYKNAINADGSLGEDVTLIDLTQKAGFTNCTLTSFAYNESGNLYLSINGHPRYSLFAVEGDNIAPYYTDDIAPTNIKQITWGSGRYLYLNINVPAANVRVYRMGMVGSGARYNGR